MKIQESWKPLLTVGVFVLLIAIAPGPRASEEQAQAAPQKVAAPGKLVRLGYNDEGHVVLGYRVANESVGQEWLLLEVGMTLIKGVEPVTVTRDSLFIETPDGSQVPLATQKEFSDAYKVLKKMDKRANYVRDSIDYLPKTARTPGAMRFFSITGRGSRRSSRDEFQLSSSTRCFDRIYFHVPGGIQYGQYFLNVQLRDTTVRVPFRIMTKDELKEAKAEYKQMKKEAKKGE